MYPFRPGPGYQYSTEKGDSGESVAALQVNLVAWGFSTLVIDGQFALNTDTAVRQVQKTKKLTVDGVAGPKTQRALCLDLMGFGHDRYSTPTGLLRGICEHESGYIVAAYAPHPSDTGFDLGPFQDSFPPRAQTQADYRHAYDAKATGLDTAERLRSVKNGYSTAPKATTNKRRWQLAALYHNWPFAADNLAYHGTIFPDDPNAENQPAQWVMTASGGRLSTPLEWANDYITKVCQYTVTWTA